MHVTCVAVTHIGNMNRAQKRFSAKVFLAILLLSTCLLFSEEISAVIGNRGEVFMWLALVIFVVVAFNNGKSTATHIPTYAERHSVFGRILDENPWMKIFYTVYGVAVVIGVFYVMSIEVGIVGFLGALFLVMLPIIIIKIKQAYIEAGNERE